jgi:hypothetical protein
LVRRKQATAQRIGKIVALCTIASSQWDILLAATNRGQWMNHHFNSLDLIAVPMVEGTLLVLLVVNLAQVASYGQFIDRCQAKFVGYLRDLARVEAPRQSLVSVEMTIDGIELKRVPQEQGRFKRRK